MYTYHTQKALRAAFWETFPDLPRRRYRYGWSRSDKTAELVYPVDTRVTFCDWLDALQSDGRISEALAARATL